MGWGEEGGRGGGIMHARTIFKWGDAVHEKERRAGKEEKERHEYRRSVGGDEG